MVRLRSCHRTQETLSLIFWKTWHVRWPSIDDRNVIVIKNILTVDSEVSSRLLSENSSQEMEENLNGIYDNEVVVRRKVSEQIWNNLSRG
jgi:hypothetical protein